jgi:hypothetical protein
VYETVSGPSWTSGTLRTWFVFRAHLARRFNSRFEMGFSTATTLPDASAAGT